MDTAVYVDWARLEADRFRAAIPTDGDLTASVPACPEWDVADLVWHLGEVHHFWTEIVARRLRSPRDVVPAVRPKTGDLVGWYDATAARMIDVLTQADPADTVWTWSSQNDVAFVRRRMAQETMVHRWDLECAVGRPSPLDPELAADGVDEFVEFMMDATVRSGSRVAVEATDTGGRWTVGAGPAPSATIAGPSADLLLVLWRRAPLAGLSVTGDRVAAEAFVSANNLD